MPILDWLNKEEAVKESVRVPYRLLKSIKKYSYGDANSENMLIQGDNLEALKALLPLYAGQVKCIYIDPPYNTKSAFEHYDDNLEHSQWLTMMYPRLELLRELLAEDGSIWVSIDDSEAAYLKVMMDEIFGRDRFVASNVWQKRYSRENREAIGDVHEYVYVYAMNKKVFKKNRNKVPLNEEQGKVYRNPNDDPKGRWRTIPITAQAGHATPDQFYEIVSPSGKVHKPSKGRCWGFAQGTFERLRKEGRIYFGKGGNSQPNLIRYLSEVEGMVPWTWWPSVEVGHTDESKKEILALFHDQSEFDTPKPERLMERIFHIATNPDDLILDSFLGSGTSAAVAQKMNRRYIGIEMGEHATTHCQPRLKKVVDGEQGGISKAVEWQGGGGFNFYRLGETVFDEEGRINPAVRFITLASHLWFTETGHPLRSDGKQPFLGLHQGVAYALLYNGILGDKSASGGNVLTRSLFKLLREQAGGFEGPWVGYGEASRITLPGLKREQGTFKQTPYDIKVR